MRLGDFDALILDLDGVITRTATLHAAAWKRLFDGYLAERARRTGEPFRPFDEVADYRRYVDGKPREDGVASFLGMRGIHLPSGGPADPPGSETTAALGRRKDRLFQRLLGERGVAVYPTTLALVRAARARGLRTAVVSSSKNCAPLLDAAGIADLFDTRVDGLDQARLGLRGKPAPDAFLEATRRLGVPPARAVVFEDALAGVEAGRRGGFGLVVGVDRIGQAQALGAHGAHVVVRDLGELRFEDLAAASPPPT